MTDQIGGAWIRALRKRLGVSQIELAALLGVSNVTINRWEHDRATPHPATVERLLRAERDGIAALTGETPTISGNLPFIATPLLGREDELARLSAFLHPGTVVTLSGIGGIGKTRLAIEIARQHRDRFSGGIWFIDLSPVSDPAGVAATVARLLSIRESGRQSLPERIGESLRERALLLLLDTCEHQLAAVSELASTAFGGTSAVLATSRAPLGLAGEQIVALSPLDRETATALFTARAQAQQGGAAIAATNDGAIAQLCQRLDNLPLAIELAAARTHVLSIAQIGERLDRRFELLRTTGPGNPRQQALETTIAWSWELLSSGEATLLRRLGIFAGGFDLAAIEAVCEVPEPLDRLAALARQSLLVIEQGAVARYRLLDSLAEFARGQLEISGETDRIAAAHAGHYRALTVAAADELKTARQIAALATLDRDYANIRAALAWTIANQPGEAAISFAATLSRYWTTRGLFVEGSDWLTRALATAPAEPMPAMVTAYAGRGRLLINAGQLDDAERSLRAAIELARRLDDRRGEASALDALGLVFRGRGELPQAGRWHQRGYERALAVGDRVAAGTARLNLALIAGLGGDDEAAERGCHEALELLRDSGDLTAEAGVVANLGGIVGSLGRVREAIAYYDRAVALFRTLGDRDRMSISIGNAAETRASIGDYSGALPLILETEQQFRQSRNAIQLAGTLYIKGVILAGAQRQIEALAALRESLELYQRLNDWPDIAYTIEAIAALHADRGDARLAARLLGGAERLREQYNVADYPLFDMDGLEARIRRAVSSTERLELARAGWEQPPSGLVFDALQLGAVTNGRPTHLFVQRSLDPAAAPADPLTARQREILQLVAAGSSNRAIAEHLAISPRTVERHLSTIFIVLDVDGRAAAVAAAAERGLLTTRN